LNEGASFSAVFDDMLLRLHGTFRDEFLETVFEIAKQPGEHQVTLLLESWLGELPIALLRNDCWHRYYKVNERYEDRYAIASRAMNETWGEDCYVSLKNLSALDFLTSVGEGSVMFTLAGESLWTMSNTELQDCLKAISRCLHKNGAVIVLGLVQPGNSILREFHFDKLKRRLPQVDSITKLLEERFSSTCSRTEEDFCIMFLEAEFEYECICKNYPFQAWMLTHSSPKRAGSRLFSVY
jgi:hypothetical protein